MKTEKAKTRAPGKHKGKSGAPYRSLVISLLISVILLAWGMNTVESLSPAAAWTRLLKPLLRLLLLIGVGLLVAQAIEAKGWTKKLGALAGPMFRFAHLGHRCSAAFSTAFFSGVAANAMLVEYYQEGKLTRKQVFLTNFINQLPAFFLHLPTTFFIVVPLTRMAGVLYFVLTFLAVVLRTILCLLYGRFFMPDMAHEDFEPAVTDLKRSPGRKESVWAAVKRRLPSRFTRIAIYVVPIYVAVFLIHIMGGFEAVRQWMTDYFTITFVPVEALSVVILSFAAEFTSGFAAAGALLEAGAITVKQTVIALLIGNVLAFPIRALRHQLPRYMGIFSPAMGTQILLLGQLFRVASLILVGWIYYLVA